MNQTNILTTSKFLNINYYLVLELPFNLMLVYYRNFSHLDDAEAEQLRMPYFKIADSPSLDKWGGKTLRVPLRKNKAKPVYVLRVTGEVEVEASSQEEAQKKIHTLMGPHITKIEATVVRKKEITKL